MIMENIHLLTSLLVVAGFVVLAWLKRSGGRPAGLAPVAKPFMTRREQAALAALEQVLPMYRIHAQVAMGALLRVPSVPGRRVTPADWNPFARKIVDFVVEDPTTGRVIALLEVDDASHNAVKDRERDRMTARAGYRTLRIPAGAKPTIRVVGRVVGRLRPDAAAAAVQG
jgi:hypothetical protein